MSEPEQVLHRRLSVLPGGFTRAAATAVGTLAEPTDDAIAAHHIPDLLAALVNRSMLTTTRSTRPGGPSIFMQLATVRSHAAHALNAVGESDMAVDRRNGWVRDFFAARPRVSRADDGWCALANDSWATVRSTLQHTLVERPDPLGWRILSRLQSYWYNHGKLVEGGRWLGLTHGSPPPGTAPLDIVLTRLGQATVAGLRGRSDQSHAVLVEVLPDVERLPPGDLPALSDGLAAMANVTLLREQHDQTRMIVDTLQRVADAAGTEDIAVMADSVACIAIAGEPGADHDALAERAAGTYHRAIAEGNVMAASLAAQTATTLALRRLDHINGALWTRRAIERQLELGASRDRMPLENRGNLAFLAGDLPRAARIYVAAQAQSRRDGTPWPFRTATAGFYDALREAMSDADFEQARIAGEALKPVDVPF